jgi:hypothetical protein
MLPLDSRVQLGYRGYQGLQELTANQEQKWETAAGLADLVGWALSLGAIQVATLAWEQSVRCLMWIQFLLSILATLTILEQKMDM